MHAYIHTYTSIFIYIYRYETYVLNILHTSTFCSFIFSAWYIPQSCSKQFIPAPDNIKADGLSCKF